MGLFIFALGVGVGGYFFSDSKPRTLLHAEKCATCLGKSEIVGLIASVGIQKTPFLLPNVVFETEKTIVLDFTSLIDVLDLAHSEYKNRYIFIPKQDIKSLSDYTDDDKSFILDLHASVVEVVKSKNIKHYKFYTSGPDRQHINYLHYHLAF